MNFSFKRPATFLLLICSPVLWADTEADDTSPADDEVAQDAKKEETDLEKLERCRSERWQGWCSSSKTIPDANPTAEGDRSVSCLKVSLSVFREVFQTRKSGSASLASSVADVNSAADSYRAGNGSVSSSQSVAGITSGEKALAQFKVCQAASEKLKKYLDAYSRDKESTRSFCARPSKAANESDSQRKLTNLDQTISFHREIYVKTIAEYRETFEISDDESKTLKIDKLAKAKDRDYGSALGSILSELKKNCEQSEKASQGQIKVATGSKATADSFVGPQNAGEKETTAAANEPKKKNLLEKGVDKAKDAAEKEMKKLIDSGAATAGDAVREATGLAPKNPAPSLNQFTTSEASPAPTVAAEPIKATTTPTPAPAITRPSTSTTSGAPVTAPNPATNAATIQQIGGSVNGITAAVGKLQSQDQNLQETVQSEGTTGTVTEAELREKCSKLPTSGTLTTAQKTLKEQCVRARIRVGPG